MSGQENAGETGSVVAPDLGGEKYLSFTTYRKDGSAKALPVWIADLGDGTLGFTTDSKSYKARRLQNDSRVLLQPCDSRGNITAGSTSWPGTAQVVVGGTDFQRVSSAIKNKYGWAFHAIGLYGKVAKLFGKYTPSDSAVIINLDHPERG